MKEMYYAPDKHVKLISKHLLNIYYIHQIPFPHYLPHSPGLMSESELILKYNRIFLTFNLDKTNIQ